MQASSIQSQFNLALSAVRLDRTQAVGFETALFHASVPLAFSEMESMNDGGFPNSHAGYSRSLAVSKGFRLRPMFNTPFET
jgi:hypothetical protein